MEFNVPSKTQRLRLCSDTDEGQDLTAAQLASRRTARVRLRRELRWLLIARSIGTWPYSPWHFQPLISSLLWRSTPREVRRTHVTWFSRWYEGCESPSVVVHHRVQLWWRHRPRSISISSCSNSSVCGFFSRKKKIELAQFYVHRLSTVNDNKTCSVLFSLLIWFFWFCQNHCVNYVYSFLKIKYSKKKWIHFDPWAELCQYTLLFTHTVGKLFLTNWSLMTN